MSFLSFVFGNKDKKTLKSAEKIVATINGLEKEFEVLSDEELKSKTNSLLSCSDFAWQNPYWSVKLDKKNIKLGKARRKRWLGLRPVVRGVAKNPVEAEPAD